MRVYDFDGTIYKGDSSIDLFLFAFKKKPIIITLFFRYVFAVLLYILRIKDKTYMKEMFYTYLGFFKNNEIDILLKEFWDENIKKVFPYYLSKKSNDDVIISASPEFSLRVICKRLGVGTLIASKVDKHTGRYDGVNCRGNEKVIRFFERFPDLKSIEKPIDEFYSDSLADTPLALKSKKAFLIDKKGNIKSWV